MKTIISFLLVALMGTCLLCFNSCDSSTREIHVSLEDLILKLDTESSNLQNLERKLEKKYNGKIIVTEGRVYHEDAGTLLIYNGDISGKDFGVAVTSDLETGTIEYFQWNSIINDNVSVTGTVEDIQIADKKMLMILSQITDITGITNTSQSQSSFDLIDYEKYKEFSHDGGDILHEGECGDNLLWRIYEDKVLEITGYGRMWDWEKYYDVPWYDYSEDIEKLQLNYGMTSIGNNAFRYKWEWYSNYPIYSGELNIPESVVRIGSGAFFDCYNFTGDLIIPSGVKEIGDAAFHYCRGFDTLSLSNGVEKIGNAAFSDCKGFSGNLYIPESVYEIGASAFSHCEGLSGDLVLPNSIKVLGKMAFDSCAGLNGIVILPDGIDRIEESTFWGCKNIVSVSLPDNLKSIGLRAFQNCSSLTGDLIIPEYVESIESYAFWGTDIKNFYFYGNAPKIGEASMTDKTNIKIFRLSETNGWPSSNDLWHSFQVNLFEENEN